MDSIFGTLLLLFALLHLVNTGSVPKDKNYLYLGPKKILELPSLAELPCQQPDDIFLNEAAAVVPYHGADTLMRCGLDGCHVWRQSGWEQSDTKFNRWDL